MKYVDDIPTERFEPLSPNTEELRSELRGGLENITVTELPTEPRRSLDISPENTRSLEDNATVTPLSTDPPRTLDDAAENMETLEDNAPGRSLLDTVRRGLTMLGYGLLLGATISASPQQPRTLTVDKDAAPAKTTGTYTSFQEAVGDARPGDQLRLSTDNFEFNGTIPKGVNITGGYSDGDPETTIKTTGMRFEERSENTLEDVVLYGAEQQAAQDALLEVKNSSPFLNGVRIRRSASAGISITDGSSPDITNAVVTDNQGDGVVSEWSSPNIVNATIAENNGYGVVIKDGANDEHQPRVVNSIIWGNQAGGIDFTEATQPQSYTVTGATTQEGLILPNADVEIRDQATGELIGNTTTNATGDFTFTTTTTGNYTAEITADTDEHLEDTATVDITGEGTFDAGTLDLNRTVYVVNHDVTGFQGDISGAIVEVTTTNNTYTNTTDTFGETTTDLDTPDDAVTRTVTKAGYEERTDQLGLNGQKNQDDTVTLQEIIYAVTANTTDQNGDALNPAVTLTENGDIIATKTATNGTAEFTGITLADDVYDGDTGTVTAEKTGYDDATTSVVFDKANPSKNVSLAQNIINYEFNVTATDNAGNPLSNADIVLEDGSAPTETATTNASGDATVTGNIETGITPGENISVEATKAGYDADTQSVTAEPSNRTKNISLSPSIIEYTWNVDVTDDSGNPLSNANVVLEDGSDPTETATTNTSGDATVSGTVETGVQENETISLEATLSGYQSGTTTVTADPSNRTKTATLQLTPESTSSEYTITFNIDEVEVSGWEAPGDLEELIVEAGTNTYTLDTSDETETATITVPNVVTEITLTQDDADYITTFVANNTWNESAPDWRTEPDYQGNTSITIPVSALNQNGDSEYHVTVIPATSPDGYSTIGDISPEVNESARWIGNNPDIKLCVIKEDRNGNEITDQEYSYLQNGSMAAIARTAAPVDTVETETLQECIDDVASPRNNEDVSLLRYGAELNAITFSGRFIKNSNASANDVNSAKSETFEGLMGYDDAGVVFFNPDATFNATAEFYSNIVYTIRSASDIE